ncbi:hypothetical protein CHS0354_040718 [Potamilus streckersoni]|uniref:CWF19-like protein 1 n=1 Tax=Potamilus streckersoni TaxID=2493646 RepID=A0AAE0SM56_9BIVA|nr:hypothetical protein CHS0354_040718 [Potamilus streckersoni]
MICGMANKSLRILVSGDVEGNFDQLYSRISSIQKKSGAFDLLLCVGDFFGNSCNEGWQEYVSGSKKVPIPTLILGPNKSEHFSYYKGSEGSDLCSNVTYLGMRGNFTGSSGLQLAYLSGVEGSENKGDKCHFTSDDVKSLIDPIKDDTKFKGVDILITSQWPKNVEKYGTTLEDFDTSSCGSEALAQLALHLRPRYYFCGLEDVHYERNPYRNHKVLAEKERHVTRFIALAKVGNRNKKKYLYAFNIVPMSNLDPVELANQPPDVTECPFKLVSLTSTQQLAEEDKPSQFFYDMKSQKRMSQNEGNNGAQKKKRPPPQPTGPCWFCLGSPQVEKHLVVSVGEQTYLALAKGGLVPDHVLILPIGHYQSTVMASSEVIEEIDNYPFQYFLTNYRYKNALKKCFKKQGKAVVFFERNYKTQHLQIQVVPVPSESVPELKESFLQEAESESLELSEIPLHSDIKQIISVGVPYFYAELPKGEKLLHKISKQFPLQFGRSVLAGSAILNMPERVDWKACSMSQEQEKETAREFKDTFKPFDFNM